MRRLIPMFAGLLLAATPAVPAAASSAYTMVDLGTLGGTQAEAFAVNSRGTVVGWADEPGPRTRAFRATRHGTGWTMRALDDLRPDGFSQAFAVNALDEAAGEAVTPAGQTHAVRWDRAGRILDLGTLGGTESRAAGINNLGVVVGTSTTPTGERHAFAWTALTGMVDLGLGVSSARGVNNLGVIVGEAGGRAFRRTPGGLVSFLGPGTAAVAINHRGDAAVTTAAAAAAEALWLAGGGLQPVRPGEPAVATGLNDRRMVCGTVAGDAFVGAVTLPRPQDIDAFAEGVNNAGLVAGHTFDVATDTARAVVWLR